MNFINLIIAGIEIPIDASHTINQSYEALASSSILRMANGAGQKQTIWTGKTRISTNSNSRLPPAILALDYTAAFSLSCVAPLSVYSASTAIILPANNRTDISVSAYAIVNGRAVRTPIQSWAGSTATVLAVTAAASYMAVYYPTFTVLAQAAPTVVSDARSGLGSWSLIVEQV